MKTITGYKLSRKCLQTIDKFLLDCEDITEEEREELLERINKVCW